MTQINLDNPPKRGDLIHLKWQECTTTGVCSSTYPGGALIAIRGASYPFSVGELSDRDAVRVQKTEVQR